MPPWVWREHLARYQFAAGYARGKVVVDCACGDGIGSAVLLDAGAASVEGFDRSASAVAEASARCRSSVARFRAADARHLPLPDRCADLYVALETIEHVEDDRAFLADVIRVLKPDGLFICSTPNRTVTNPGTAVTDRPWNRYHRREYNHGEFVRLLEQAFERVDCYGQRPMSRRAVAWWTAIAHRWSPKVAVTCRQISKWPRLVYDAPASYAVRPLPVGAGACEYLVAVCRRPRRAAT